MSPRITALARLVIIAFVVALAPLAAHAQTCTPPAIAQIGGLNPTCTGSPVTLDAGAGWATYAWSNGATTRTITDTPLVDTTYTVTTTDGLGCSVTSAPFEVTTYATLAPPVIQTPAPDVCPLSSAPASVAPPPVGTVYTAYEWSVVNGTFQYGNTSQSVTFVAGETGDVELSVTVTDENGCQATSTTTIPLTSIPPPVINLYEPEICPGPNGYGYAGVAPPPAGIEYTEYEWSIVNGTITYGVTSSSVMFEADGNGPVELSVRVRDDRGCESTNSINVEIRTIPPPVINLYEPSICPGPNGYGYAGVAPPPAGIEYIEYEWSILNGTITYGVTSSSVMFKADGNGPVELSVRVRDDRGCESTNSINVEIRTIPPPVINLYEPSICPGPNGSGYAGVAPPPAGIDYTEYEWSIINGTITYGITSSSVMFKANGNGPVELGVRVRDTRGCESTNSISVAIRTLPPPVINLYEPTICPGPNSNGYAGVAPPPAGIEYMEYEWSIVNGTITYGSTSSSIVFTADGTGPVQLTVQVRDDRGCESTNSVTVPLGGTPPPITILNPNDCSTQVNRATIDPSFTSITWSVTGGTLISGQGTNEIEFSGNGGGGVSVSVSATGSTGCAGTNTAAIPAGVTPIPLYAPETACVGSLQKVRAETISGQHSFNWTVTNATVEGPTDQFELLFRSDGTGPVTVSVNALEWGGCPTSNSVTIPLGPMPEPELLSDYPTLCDGASGNVYLSWMPGDVYPNYQWSITNGYFGSTYGTTVWFQHTPGAGDVTVTLTVGEGSCTRTVSRTFPVVDPPEPVFELATTTFCHGTTNTLYFDNYESFTNVQPYIGNVQLLSTGPGRVPGGRAYTFRTVTAGNFVFHMYVTSGSCTLLRIVSGSSQPSTPTITPSGPTTFCEGGSVTLTASAGSNYQWQSGQTTQSITVTQSGTYTVTVTLPNGCTGQASRTVTVQPLPGNTIAASGPTTFCQGGSVTLTAPAGSSYAWSTGATTPSIIVAAAGSYGVTVTGANGCTRVATPVAVTVHPKPAAGIQSTHIYEDPGTGSFTRTGDDIQACGNPTVRLIAQALDPSFTYSWSHGANTAVIDVTTSGTYTLTVTTPNGCSTTSSVNVTYSAIPATPTIAATGTELCPAGGSVTLTAPAADAWTWSNGATTQSIVVTEPGSYTVRVRVGACDSQLSEPVVVTTGISSITTNDSLALCGPGSSATLTANAGTSWLWSNGATTQSIVVTEPGSYTVITTNLGCTMPESAPAVVTTRSVTIEADGPTAFCVGDSVTLTASSGTSWLWSNGATTQSITVSTSGSYGVTATYGDGCSIAATPVVVEARQISATVVADRTTVCTNGAIQLSASATGGAGYTYQWYDNTYTAIPGATSPTLTINPSVSGFVYVKVTDELGCIGTSSGTVYTVLPTPDATITTAAALCEGQSGSASVADAGPGTTYAWTITNGTLNFPSSPVVTFTPSGLDPVTLNVTITNAGCSVSSSRTVTVNPLPVVAITPSGPTTFCTGGSVTLTVTAGASYAWSNGATTQSITVSDAGSYSVTVTNANGCSAASAPTTVTVNDLPAATITAGGPTTFCTGGSVTLTASAGASWLWSNGATTQSVNATTAGDYTVTVTNANGCSTTSSATTVTVNPLPVATISASGPTTFCAGGSVTLTASAGTSWAWSNGATTQSITVSDAGSYSVTVTNANGCSAASSATTVTVNALPVATISASGPTTFCAGGSVTLTASAGASYAWSNGATTQSITVSDAGNYSVTVTNANGCSAASSATTVTVNALPVATISASGPTTFCTGGSVTLTASAATSYAWSNGATTQSITVSDAGSYSVTITNANGCSAASSATTVTVNALPVVAITPSGPTTFCEGGSVTLTATEGTSYAWSTGATTQSITVSDAGSYSVTVTNANGCSAASAPVTVTTNDLPVATIAAGGPTTFCTGGSVTLTASAGTSWLWSNGATTQSIEVTTAGDYSVTVTNADGCSTTSSATTVTVNALPAATISASGPTTFCAGGSVTLTASAGTSWAWSNGATTQSITVSDAGSYSVTVTNANGCSATSAPSTVTVNELPAATITAGGPTTFCTGGSVTLTASAGASYLWSNGATTSSINVTAAGNYTVTVTSAAGCSATSSATTVTVNALPAATISAGGPTTFCAGGSVTLTASAGTSWLWSNGATTQAIDVTESGSYTVTVTNANGCSQTSAATAVTVKPLPTPTVTADGPTTFCQGGSVTLTGNGGPGTGMGTWYRNGVAYSTSYTLTVSAPVGNTTYFYRSVANGCIGDSDPVTVTIHPNSITSSGGNGSVCWNGSAFWEVNGAVAGSTYAWTVTNGSVVSGADASRLNYSPAAGATSVGLDVIITTPAGCSLTRHYDIPVDRETPASIEASGPTTFCTGGSVTLTMPTAPAGWTYRWSNFATTQSITVSSSGTYTARYMKVAGSCYGPPSDPVTVNVNPLPAATISASGPTTFCAGGSVTLTASAGDSYLWSNGATSQSIDVTSSGSYTVTVTNASGCEATSAATTVTVNDLPAATISTSGPTTFCAGGSVTLTASAGSSYLWSNGATTPSINVTSSGSYSVTVMNANGCSATSSATAVTVNPLPAATITPSGATTFCEGGSVTLTASAGTSYLWSNGATTPSIDVTSSGSYSVTVTNANGCSATSAATAVTVNALPAATITPSGATTFCEGGSVTLTASAGSSYLWSNGATTPSINVTSSGSYSVTVTNANGCSATSAATAVTVNALPAATITPSGATTFCEGGSVTLTASAGSSYLWSNGATTPSINVTSSGSYSATVTNANGCSATSSATAVTVNAASAATITPSGATTFCEGGSVTLTASEGSSYLWSNGATTSSINVTSSGSYSVTVTNANGCSATSAATTVTVDAPPAATITPSGATTFCTGGSVTLTASAGSTYLWSTGATTPSIDVTSNGSYSVTVTNATGCSATSPATTVTVNTASAATITPSGATTFCEGGSVTLTASTGSSYLWSNGATTSSINVTSSGSYSVTVTNANGCSSTSPATTVTVNPLPAATITPTGATTFCQGGSVTLTASAGSSWLWSTGATTQAISVSAGGNYSVTVTNANGCSATSAPTTVTVNAQPQATITPSGSTSFCAGGSVTLTANSGASYLWSTGAITPSINVSAGGSYTVTVTYANGCSSTSAATTVTVNANPSTPTITPSGPTTFCAGGSVTLNAPAGFTSYLWSNGAITPSINVSATGNYTVTVTNASGCSATSAPSSVTVNPATSITAQPQSATIPRNTTTQLSVTAGGTGPFTYQWYRGTSPSTAQPISGATISTYTTPRLGKGTYTYWVRVTGACGVVNSNTATISVP